MKDLPRQRRIDVIAGDGVKLGGRLVLGLLAAPLLGLALLSTRTARQASRSVEHPELPPKGSVEVSPIEAATGDPEVPQHIPDGPIRADIEDALRKLTEATIPNRARPASQKQRTAKSAKHAAGSESPARNDRRSRPKRADPPPALPH